MGGDGFDVFVVFSRRKGDLPFWGGETPVFTPVRLRCRSFPREVEQPYSPSHMYYYRVLYGLSTSLGLQPVPLLFLALKMTGNPGFG